MIKYIAYCRKSTDEKDKQVLSIEAQIAELKEFAKRENLTITEFITEAKTAKVPGREQFAEVQKQIEKIERPRQKGHNFAFAGLATCGECGAAITAEQHVKKYKNGTGQTFVYYRCTKKLKPCTQKYTPESETETQLRKIVGDCGLHEGWEPYFEK